MSRESTNGTVSEGQWTELKEPMIPPARVWGGRRLPRASARRRYFAIRRSNYPIYGGMPYERQIKGEPRAICMEVYELFGYFRQELLDRRLCPHYDQNCISVLRNWVSTRRKM